MKPISIFLSLLTLLILETNNDFKLVSNDNQHPKQERPFDENFKERYSARKFNYEGKQIVNKNSSTPTDGENSKYGDENPNIKEDNNKVDTDFNFNFSWLFIAILILAIIYLAFIILSEGSSGLFSSRKNIKIDDFNEITAENIEHIDVLSLINKAENNDDYRLAIRYYYLLVLKTLSIKKFINFEDDKTNAEYLNEIGTKDFSENFAYTSYLYNYIWYGEFSVNTEQYTKAKDNFIKLLDQVK